MLRDIKYGWIIKVLFQGTIKVKFQGTFPQKLRLIWKWTNPLLSFSHHPSPRWMFLWVSPGAALHNLKNSFKFILWSVLPVKRKPKNEANNFQMHVSFDLTKVLSNTTLSFQSMPMLNTSPKWNPTSTNLRIWWCSKCLLRMKRFN